MAFYNITAHDFAFGNDPEDALRATLSNINRLIWEVAEREDSGASFIPTERVVVYPEISELGAEYRKLKAEITELEQKVAELESQLEGGSGERPPLYICTYDYADGSRPEVAVYSDHDKALRLTRSWRQTARDSGPSHRADLFKVTYLGSTPVAQGMQVPEDNEDDEDNDEEEVDSVDR